MEYGWSDHIKPLPGVASRAFSLKIAKKMRKSCESEQRIWTHCTTHMFMISSLFDSKLMGASKNTYKLVRKIKTIAANEVD
jgi:hypothetical protein